MSSLIRSLVPRFVRSLIIILISSCLVSCTPYIVFPENQSSSEVPLSASELGWIEVSPINSLTITANWARSLSPELSRQMIQFFMDGNCLLPFGQPLNLPADAHSQVLTGVNGGIYSYTIASQESGKGPEYFKLFSPDSG